jgi:membrane-bound ClpP family serine protease
MIPFIFLALGLLLILLEFYMPGVVMGAIGSILVVTSIILFAYQTQTAWQVVLFVLGSIVAVVILIKFALWRIPRSKSSFNIYSGNDQEGYQASSFDNSTIGKKGVVLTDLKPGGHILLEGRKLQALSQSGYLVKGTEVIVIGGEEESLIVKHIKKDT